MVLNSKPVNFSRVLHPSAVAGCPLLPLQLNQHMQILNCSRNPKLGDDIHDMLHFSSPNSLLSWESLPSHNFYITNVFFLIMCVVCLSIDLSLYRSIDLSSNLSTFNENCQTRKTIFFWYIYLASPNILSLCSLCFI